MTAKQFVELRDLLTLQCQLLMDMRAYFLADAEAETSAECPHPEERRVSLSTPGDLDHWVCLDCKKDNKQAPMN